MTCKNSLTMLLCFFSFVLWQDTDISNKVKWRIGTVLAVADCGYKTTNTPKDNVIALVKPSTFIFRFRKGSAILASAEYMPENE